MDRTDQIRQWQDWYANRGLISFPLFGITNGECRCDRGASCKQPGKHPKISGWRTLDAPAYVGALDNLGVSTDPLVVVDVDHGEVPADLPDTFTVQTARGYHLWYRADKSHPIRNAAGWRPGVDLRAVGGLVAAPPSRTVTGGEYRYAGGGDIAPVPGFILEERQRYTERRRRPEVESVPTDTLPMIQPLVDGLVDEIQGAQTGERNHTLFRVACRFFEMAERGLMGTDALQEIMDAAISIGLSAHETTQTIQSASRSLTE